MQDYYCEIKTINNGYLDKKITGTRRWLLFSGHFLATRSVVEELPAEEILSICQDIKSFVRSQNGIDYLQVYVDEGGRKLYLIDQLTKQMVESGEYAPLDNHCTLLWAHEY